MFPTPPEPEMPEIEAGVFPNPTDGVFTVKSDIEGFTDLVVFDVFGNQILPLTRFYKSIEIDATHWSSGVYFVYYGAPVKMGKRVKLVKL